MNQNNEITGRVQVYENQAGLWVQKGQDLNGVDDLFNTFGQKVELSSDGNTLAIFDPQIPINLIPGQSLEDFLGDLLPQYFPYIKVFQFNNGSWVQVGNDFLFNDVLDYLDFSISGNGNTIAIGTYDGVDVYTLNGGNWSQVGIQIPSSGTDMNDKSISLSEDGNEILIGDSFFMDSSMPNQSFIDGEVKVFQNISNTWTQVGNSITTTSDIQFFGYTVDLSSDGSTMAVASEKASVNDNLSILENINGVWTLKGTEIQSIERILSIDLLDDASAIAISEDNAARVLRFNADWEQVNRSIKGPNNSDFGNSIAIADNGDVFAVGAPFLETNDSGFVSIYGTNPNKNLLFNGSAEILPAIGNGWTQTQGNTTSFFSPLGSKHGDHFFYANTSPLAEFYQDVDVSSFASEIDAGNKAFKFSGYVRSFDQGNPDEGQAIIEYKDANGVILDTYNSGEISSIGEYALFEDTRAAPIGTRSIKVTIFQIRNSGTNNDGYIDDLILQEAPGLLIPDPNFEQALIDLNIDSDGTINGEISENDPVGVIDLDVSSKNIVNLQGIEHFTDLETLTASDNNLIAVNLSENTNLITVNLDNNQLTELEVTQLSALQELSVSGNLITELYLDQNSNLEFLNASDNDLVSLDIRNGNNLNIPTQNFNVLNNPNLLCISVDDVDYSTLNWTNVGNQVSFALTCIAFNPYNLLLNGSAEVTPVIGNGWTQVVGNTTGVPDKITPFDGNNHFYANQTASSEFYQEVDLTSFASEIDTGLKAFRFSCYFNSFDQTNPDESRAVVEYRDANDVVLDTYDTGYFALVNVWTQFEDTRIAPIGTRSVKIILYQKRNTGTNNDAYIDAIAFEETTPNIAIIPDPNFEQTLIDLNIDSDATVNGSMLKSDALGITDLDVSSQNISDLTGIEHFTDLETLTASDNNLIAVNLSENTNLISVNLDNNQLAELEVTQLSALQELSVSGNLITELYLDLNSNLEFLNASDNDLVSLDIRNGNNINIPTQNFNVLNNPNLLCISVDDVDYSTLNWTNVGSDVSFAITCVDFDPDNLLFNGSAEILPAMGNGWIQVQGNTTSFFDPDGSKDGDHFFYANTSPFAEFYQEVDLTPFSSQIDTGSKFFKFSAYFSSFNQPNADESRAVIEYKDDSDNVLDSYDTGYIASIDVWTLVEDTRIAPIGTRSVKISLYQQRNAGTNNNGYIDDIVFEEVTQNLVNIPDPNFEQALIDLNIDSDETVNGFMVQSDALGVIDLDVSGQNISDLTGIEFFTDLETLSAFNNNLSSIDLSQNINLDTALLALNNLTSIDFSNNPDLISISLNDNNLSSIDLSNNTALLQVFVNNNNLSSIDVSMLSNLENLGVSSNNLTSLDISQNPNVFTLFCNDNQLQSLNVQNGNNTNFDNLETQNNSDLECINVDDVSFANTNWLNATPAFNFDPQMFFSVDCSNFILIPDANFEQVLIDEGVDTDGIINGQINGNDPVGVTNLNVSSKNITDLTGIEFFTDLESFTANSNAISGVDLSQNTALTFVDLNFNNLSSIDVSNNLNLTGLTLASNQIGTIDVSSNLSLSTLFVNDNQLSNIDVTMLSNLDAIDVSDNNLTSLDLSQNPLIQLVRCSNNDLISLNLQNGGNTNIQDLNFNATGNDNLTCIQVDDVAYSSNNWFNIDPQSFFGLDCAPDNDDCSFAQPIPLGQEFSATSFSATSSGISPGCQGTGIVIIDVWFEFVAPASGDITISLETLLPVTVKAALYENCSVQNLLGCGVDGLQVDNLIPGATYYIQAWLESTSSGLLPQNNSSEVGDFVIKVEDTTTMSGLSFEYRLPSVEIYPNPASHRVYLKSDQNIIGYQIFDINGKEVMVEDQLSTMEKSIDVNELSSGIYLLKVNGLQSSSTQKLIIK
jgi:Leucine-rich repeat (LRR) protein